MSRDSHIFYIYVYFRQNGIPCYVGKGKGNRYLVHQKMASNNHLENIIKRDGSIVVIVRDNLSESEAYETETALIKVIGRADLGLGPLANWTDGGDGMRNPSKEIRSRLGPRSPEAKKATAERARVRNLSISQREAVRKASSKAAQEARLSGKNFEFRFPRLGSPGPITDRRREAIRAAVTQYWAGGGHNHRPFIWINDGIITRRLYHPEENPIPEGWSRGRIYWGRKEVAGT